MKKRTAYISRKTTETSVVVKLDLDGKGSAKVRTGIPFLDHMLVLLAKHALLDLDVSARGDLEVDDHHTVEDIGLVIGSAINEALGDRTSIRRYGWALIPMDDCLGEAAIDLGGRPYLVFSLPLKRRKIGTFDLGLMREFLRAFSIQSRMAVHIQLRHGNEPHHACEAVFKALARALREACDHDPRMKGVPSSKGRI